MIFLNHICLNTSSIRLTKYLEMIRNIMYIMSKNWLLSYYSPHMSGTEAVPICIISEHDNMVTLGYSLPSLGVIDYFRDRSSLNNIGLVVNVSLFGNRHFNSCCRTMLRSCLANLSFSHF
jgi:hypothetical protein